ncbi:MAG: electron transport complex subunit RsxC [Gammaproteobacteria bacterium]|nr:electron transport complex subunit RsxC [Gammaproteobacteria bacterium]
MGFFSAITRSSFSHGLHPPSHKAETAGIPIKRMPFAPLLIIPLSQHIGAPSRCIVNKGDEVVRGQPIADASAALSVPIHAPATGRIKSIEQVTGARGTMETAILLQVYDASSQQVLWRNPVDPASLSSEQILQAIQDLGLVGLGGAAFPSHFKQRIPDDKMVDTLVINGSECEPYLTCDHRIMLERPEHLIAGIKLAMRATKTRRAIIGIEDNKMDAVNVLQKHLLNEEHISVQAVKTKYPQGSEKMLIKSLLNREVPAGGIPLDIGVVVNNVQTLSSLGQLLPVGEGLIERVITVTGPGIKHPGNYRVPVGTPIGFILQQVGYSGGVNEFILGGPMMGPAVSSLETPITKSCSGLLVLNEPGIQDETRMIWPCIKCGRCVSACPMHLNPAQLGLLASAAEYQQMADDYNLNHCFECGCCSYICPSNIPLVQYFRIAKAINRELAA